MRDVSVIDDKYITDDASLKGLLKIGNIATFFEDNTDFYKIARIVPQSPNGHYHNYIEFLNRNHGTNETEWSLIPYSDCNYKNPICFKTVDEAAIYLKKYLSDFKEMAGEWYKRCTFERGVNHKDPFIDCKYIIIRCVSSFDVAREFDGLVYNKETETTEKVSKVFSETSERRNDIEVKTC